MIKKFFTLLLLPLLLLSSLLRAQEGALSFQQKFDAAKAGDFIATSSQGHCSLLFIRSLTPEILILEEICIPELALDIKTIHWQEWLDRHAPGHTSWTLYEINRKTGTLVECYSISKKGWLYLNRSEQFFAQLLSLPLSEVSPNERKRIGPAPSMQEADHRALWNPPVIFHGKKIAKPALEVWKAKWPDDKSLLSLCEIELYFYTTASPLPFPYWIEVKSPHYTFKIRSVDSGRGVRSPVEGPMPHRSPYFRGLARKAESAWEIPIAAPLYFQKLKLYALCLEENSRTSIPLAFSMQSTDDPEHLLLKIDRTTLQKELHPGKRYQWVLIPEGSSDIYVASHEIFTWL